MKCCVYVIQMIKFMYIKHFGLQANKEKDFFLFLRANSREKAEFYMQRV